MRRRYRRADERQRIVNEWRGSGDTVGAFCTARGLAPASLNRWIGQEPPERARPPRARRAAEVPPPSAISPLGVGFLRLERAVVSAREGIAVEVGSAKVRVERGFDGALLLEIVDLLSKREGA